MKRTYILGNGGFAQEIFEQFFMSDSQQYNFGGFIILKNEKPYVINDDGVEPFIYPKDSAFMLGTGNKAWRRTFINHFTKYYEINIKHFPNAVSSHSYVSKMASIGVGNIFCPFSLVNANASIGNFNNFNVYSTISHDCVLEDNNVLSPYAGLMGCVKVGNENFLGASSVITPKVSIKNENTISAGEVLFDDMENREFFQSGVIIKKPSK